MTATDELRRMLDERGVEWTDGGMFHRTHWVIDGIHYVAFEQSGKLYLQSSMGPLTPEQAIAATLGNEGVARSNDGVAELGAGTCRRVYLVEVSDDLIESWCPLSVYLHREAAEDCAEALRKEEDGIRQFARVSELKVVDDG